STLDTRWLSGCRKLLRHQRLPNHLRPPRKTGTDRQCGAQAVLVQAGAAVDAGTLRAVARHHSRIGTLLPRRGREAARRYACRFWLHDELVLHPRSPVVLRRSRTAVSLKASLVARYRGAVLPCLAGCPRLARPAVADRRYGRAVGCGGGGFERADGRPLES